MHKVTPLPFSNQAALSSHGSPKSSIKLDTSSTRLDGDIIQALEINFRDEAFFMSVNPDKLVGSLAERLKKSSSRASSSRASPDRASPDQASSDQASSDRACDAIGDQADQIAQALFAQLLHHRRACDCTELALFEADPFDIASITHMQSLLAWREPKACEELSELPHQPTAKAAQESAHADQAASLSTELYTQRTELHGKLPARTASEPIWTHFKHAIIRQGRLWSEKAFTQAIDRKIHTGEAVDRLKQTSEAFRCQQEAMDSGISWPMVQYAPTPFWMLEDCTERYGDFDESIYRQIHTELRSGIEDSELIAKMRQFEETTNTTQLRARLYRLFEFMRQGGNLPQLQLFICGNDDRCVDGQDETLMLAEQLFILGSRDSTTLFEDISRAIYQSKHEFLNQYVKSRVKALEPQTETLHRLRQQLNATLGLGLVVSHTRYDQLCVDEASLQPGQLINCFFYGDATHPPLDRNLLRSWIREAIIKQSISFEHILEYARRDPLLEKALQDVDSDIPNPYFPLYSECIKPSDFYIQDALIDHLFESMGFWTSSSQHREELDSAIAQMTHEHLLYDEPNPYLIQVMMNNLRLHPNLATQAGNLLPKVTQMAIEQLLAEASSSTDYEVLSQLWTRAPLGLSPEAGAKFYEKISQNLPHHPLLDQLKRELESHPWLLLKMTQVDYEAKLAQLVAGKINFRDLADKFKNCKAMMMELVRAKPSLFQHLNLELRGDAEVAQVAIERNGWQLQFATPQLKGERHLVLLAVAQNGLSLQFASAPLNGDREIATIAVAKNGLALGYVAENLRSEDSLIESAIAQNGLALQWAPDRIRDNPEKVVQAVRNQADALAHATARLKKSKAFIQRALEANSSCWRHIDPQLQGDRELLLLALKNNGHIFRDLPLALQSDRELASTAVSQNANIYEHLNKELRSDPAIAEIAIRSNGRLLQFAEKPIYQNLPIMISAASQNGFLVRFATHRLLSNKELALAAVGQNGLSLECFSKELRADREVVHAAVMQNGLALQYASSNLQRDRAMAQAAIAQNSDALEYAAKALFKSR